MADEWEVVKRGNGYVIYQAKVRCPRTEPYVPEGWDYLNCGGAHPFFIAYDPLHYDLQWFSAKEANEVYGRKLDGEVYRADASVHGCFKLRKNQYCILFVREKRAG